jgi:membrane associated rhomboid family serine protease
MATEYYGDGVTGEGAASSSPNKSAVDGRRKRWLQRKRDSDIESTGSFSQSQEFRTIFDPPKNKSKHGSISSQFSPSKKEGLLSLDESEDEMEIYVVKQKYGYLSILFSLAQTIILIIMMVQCGVAPFNINPMIGPYPDALSDWGAKNAVNILEDGEWWRLITPIMLHAGVFHLGCNILVQLETGAFFEREWGSFSWLIIYLVSAVGSSALSVVAMPDAISVGSSGAVMGLFGGKGAEVICRFCESTKNEQDKVGHQVRKEQCAGVMCSVTIVLLFSFFPYVDWAAHLGGVLAGFCVGMIIFAADLKNAVFSKLLWLLVGVAITAVYFIVVFQRMYSGDIQPSEALRDVCGYYQQNFEDYQCNCMIEENQ